MSKSLWPVSLLLFSSLAACGDDTSQTTGSGGGSTSTGDTATSTSTGEGGSGTTGSGGATAGTGTGTATGTGTGGSGTGGSGTGGSGTGPTCTEPTEVPCEDDVFLAMNLQDDIAPGAVASEAEGTGWISTIDATAGGAFTKDPDSYVYARFTDAGLEKVEISDEDSLTSMEWDIAFRRYVVRINSANSGPSCVNAARVPGAADYDGLTTVPEGLQFRSDEYFTESCEIIPDGTGLPGSPATALSSFWTYPGCVQMTGNVFVVRQADGSHLKLAITHFYNEASQTQCQEEGTVPQSGSGSANYQVRWAYL